MRRKEPRYCSSTEAKHSQYCTGTQIPDKPAEQTLQMPVSGPEV